MSEGRARGSVLTKCRADGAAASVHQPMAAHDNSRQAGKRDGRTPDRPPTQRHRSTRHITRRKHRLQRTKSARGNNKIVVLRLDYSGGEMSLNIMDQDIRNMFCRYRDRDIGLQQLRAWLDSQGARVEAQIPRGQLLKLRRGSEAQSNGAVAQLLPACTHCLGVGLPKQFVSRIEYQQCSRRRDAAVASGSLTEIAPPPFDSEGAGPAGSATCYRCTHCHSIWAFVEPEKADNGSWSRVI